MELEDYQTFFKMLRVVKLEEGTFLACYKKAKLTFHINEYCLLVQRAKSLNPGQGEMQALLKLIKKKYHSHDIRSTVCMHPAMAHICLKMNIKLYER